MRCQSGRYKPARQLFDGYPGTVQGLGTPPNAGDGVSRLMQYLGRKYVRCFNYTYRRSGTLWEGRFKSCQAGRCSYYSDPKQSPPCGGPRTLFDVDQMDIEDQGGVGADQRAGGPRAIGQIGGNEDPPFGTLVHHL